MPKHRTRRRPKRRFSGNQFSKPAKAIAIKSDAKRRSMWFGFSGLERSNQKVCVFKEAINKVRSHRRKAFTQEPAITGFRFVDMEMVSYHLNSSLQMYKAPRELVIGKLPSNTK